MDDGGVDCHIIAGHRTRPGDDVASSSLCIYTLYELNCDLAQNPSLYKCDATKGTLCVRCVAVTHGTATQRNGPGVNEL